MWNLFIYLFIYLFVLSIAYGKNAVIKVSF
jgi:hypothetical protein